jgi:hypothetical protein
VKWKAEQEKQRKEQAIANTVGLRVLSAIGSAVPVRLMKRDLLSVIERLLDPPALLRDIVYIDLRKDSETPVHDWKPAGQTCNCSRHLGSHSRCLTPIDFFPITRSRALAEFAPEPFKYSRDSE